MPYKYQWLKQSLRRTPYHYSLFRDVYGPEWAINISFLMEYL